MRSSTTPPLKLLGCIVAMGWVYAAPPLLAFCAHGLPRVLGLLSWITMAFAFRPHPAPLSPLAAVGIRAALDQPVLSLRHGGFSYAAQFPPRWTVEKPRLPGKPGPVKMSSPGRRDSTLRMHRTGWSEGLAPSERKLARIVPPPCLRDSPFSPHRFRFPGNPCLRWARHAPIDREHGSGNERRPVAG